ncbi:MAG: hypothetical protein KF866_11540 [Phycisphaeraceae bacterium]|nr:hypothetical protein [Phycisphaeraceae bacterium]MCW5754195.1 hypothetical protein [Phycisphaeraceae bacterium]
MNLIRFIRPLVVGLTLAVVGLVAVPTALAIDKIYLKDGTVLQGKITEELEGYYWFKYEIAGVEHERVIGPDEIARVERDARGPANEAAPAKAEAARPAAATGTSRPRTTTGPRAVVLTLGDRVDNKDMVGMYMTADSIRRVIPMLEEDIGSDGSGILVLRINSGGGALLEVQKLSDIIEFELKPKFRVVAWIDWAISAAAMTSHCIEEIYFTTRGNYGACTAWFGALQGVQGRELEEILYMMEKISARGGYDPKIMRAMQITTPLSCSIDENGNVTWYESEEGEFLVNETDRVLTLTSDVAERFGFSKGTADTIEQLARAMRVPEVTWVGEWVSGVDFPVSRAEVEMRRFRDRTKEDGERFNEYANRYTSAIAVAQSTPREERGRFVNRAREALGLMVRMVRNNPNFALFNFGMLPKQFDEWVQEQERLLRDLMR